MKLLWISSLAWKKDGNYLFPVNNSGAISGSLFEQAMIEAIEEMGHSVDIINTYPYGDNYNHKGFEWSHNQKAIDYCIKKKKNKCLNYLSEICELKKRLKNNSVKYDCAIAYLIHFPFVKSLSFIKKKNNIKTILICPDLAEMMDLSVSKKPLKRLLKRIESFFLKKNYKFVDKYVFFTKHMVERINVFNKPFLFVEGINSVATMTKYEKKQPPYIVLYAGSLQFHFGLEAILEAMSFLNDDDIELHIYGDGAMSSIIQEKACMDSRIKFYGFVEHDVVLSKEKEASLLINARDPNESYTRYSFPSKTFEYIMSGTPFLTTKLPGIPEEYYDFLFLIDDFSPQGIAKAILKVKYSKEEFIKRRIECGQKFISESKNKTAQAKKFMSFIGE